MKIISVVGARPNFMKIAPFIRAIAEYNSLQSSVDSLQSAVHSDASPSRPLAPPPPPPFPPSPPPPPPPLSLYFSPSASTAHCTYLHTLLTMERILRSAW